MLFVRAQEISFFVFCKMEGGGGKGGVILFLLLGNFLRKIDFINFLRKYFLFFVLLDFFEKFSIKHMNLPQEAWSISFKSLGRTKRKGFYVW